MTSNERARKVSISDMQERRINAAPRAICSFYVNLFILELFACYRTSFNHLCVYLFLFVYWYLLVKYSFFSTWFLLNEHEFEWHHIISQPDAFHELTSRDSVMLDPQVSMIGISHGKHIKSLGNYPWKLAWKKSHDFRPEKIREYQSLVKMYTTKKKTDFLAFLV